MARDKRELRETLAPGKSARAETTRMQRSEMLNVSSAEADSTRAADRAAEGKRPSPWSRTKLSTMPLAVLLPPLSDVGQIAQHRAELDERLEAIQDDLESAESDAKSALQVEQSMIQQVLQWLDVDAEES